MMKQICTLFTILLLSTFCTNGKDKDNTKSKKIQTNSAKVSLNFRFVDSLSIVIGNNHIRAFTLPIDSISTESDYSCNADIYRLNSTLSKQYLYGYYDITNVFVLSIQYISKNYFALILYNNVDCESSFVLVTIDKHNFKLIDSETVLYFQDCSQEDIEFEMKTVFSKNHFVEYSSFDYWTNDESKNSNKSEKLVHVQESETRYCEILDNGRIIRKKSKKENPNVFSSFPPLVTE